MKICPVCGEVYRPHVARCPAHEVPLRAWHEATTDTQLGVVTDVDGRARSIDPPFEVAGELDAPWSTGEHGDAALAATPLVQISGGLGRVRAPGRGRVLGGRYRLARQLGVGGYGAVFAAEDLATGERVAIKVLTPAATQCAEMITRFHREAIAASRARHPHVVAVVDFDVDDDGSHYIVMEHLDGSDLAEVLEEARRLPPARALVIAAQCARGLAAAHRVGVLHRDLKPANVFLTQRRDGGDLVKIIDFGISKLTRAAGDYTDVTSASKVVGTPCYMSPEQARGVTLDARADVYALGVMLFEMLVGERPFTGRSALEILSKHLAAPRPRPSSLRPELATCPGLDALVLRALAPAPAARHGSMEELGEAIVACLRAIDPAAAEHATEITGELSGPADAADTPAQSGARARGQRVRTIGLALAVTAFVALAMVSRPSGRGDEILDGPGTTPEPARSPAPAAVPVAGPVAAPVAIPPPSQAPPTAAAAVDDDAPGRGATRRVVRLASTPAGATVLRDGVAIGETPLTIVLEDGHGPPTLTLQAPGYRDRRVVIGREREVVDVVLEPASPERSGAATLGVEEW